MDPVAYLAASRSNHYNKKLSGLVWESKSGVDLRITQKSSQYTKISDSTQCYCRPERSCGKVIFLHLSVILFTGGVWQTLPPGSHCPQADTPLGRHPQLNTPLDRHTLKTATAADGKHPTGMHSSLFQKFISVHWQ